MSQSYFPTQLMTDVPTDVSVPPAPALADVLSSGQDAQNAFVNQRER